MQICGFSVSQEDIHKFMSLFHINPTLLPKLEQESSKLAMMGQSSLTVSIVRQAFAPKRYPQPGEVSEVVKYYTSGAHIVSYLKHRLTQTHIVISTSKLSTIFYCFCQLSIETSTPNIMDFTMLDTITAELISFNTDTIASDAVIPDIDVVDVPRYNMRRRNGPSSHVLVKLPYMTGSGKQREIVCCPQCGTDAVAWTTCGHANLIHAGEIELTRETKSSTNRTRVIARWSCCGAAIATTDTSVAGYRLEVEALQRCISLE